MSRSAGRLGDASLFNDHRHFRAVTMAVAAADRDTAKLVKKVLSPLGCSTVHVLLDSVQTLTLLKRQPIDILVIDREVGGLGGLETVRRLRHAHDSPGRTVPVIYLSADTGPAEVTAALATGVSEFVAKPYSARSLLAAVHAVVEEPRAFVLSRGYVGPDRRGVTAGPSPSGRTVLCEHLPSRIVPPVRLRTPHSADEPCVVLPDYGLKHRLGLSRGGERDYITEAVVVRSEQALAVARARFTDDIQTNISSLLHLNRMMIQHGDRRVRLVETLRHLTALIERQTQELGYAKVTEVARLLLVYCDRHAPDTSNTSMLVIEKHALALSAVLSTIRRYGTEAAANDLIRDLHDQIGLLGR